MDVWLVKTDAAGNEQWNKTFGGLSTDRAYSFQQTSDNGYILVGETKSFGAGEYDAYVIKTDLFGNQLWVKTFGGISWDMINSVYQTSSSEYVLAGGTQSFGVGSYMDTWLIKIDSVGNEQWNKTFGGITIDYANFVRQTLDDEYILAGYMAFDDGSLAARLLKVDSSGNQLWLETYNGMSTDYGSFIEKSPEFIQQTSDGGYILAVQAQFFGAGNSDAWLIKVASETDQSQEFSFAQITDVHIGPNAKECFKDYISVSDWQKKCAAGREDSNRRFTETVNSILELQPRPDIVLISGDVVEWSSPVLYREFNSAISKFNDYNIKVYIVPGNHDRRGLANPTKLTDAVLPCTSSNCLRNYKKYISDNYPVGVTMKNNDYYFDYKGTRFIGISSGSDILPDACGDIFNDPIAKFLDNYNKCRGLDVKGSGLSKTEPNNQMKFVEDNIVDGKTVVFMHHPVENGDNSISVISENREFLKSMAVSRKINLILAGHTHRSRFFNIKGDTNVVYKDNVDNPTVYSLPSEDSMFVQTRNSADGYLLVVVKNNGEIELHERMVAGRINDVTTITLYSPADLHVYDQFGRHTGINATGGIDNQIPDSYYLEELQIANSTLPASIILYNNSLNYSAEIVSNFSKENITAEQSHFNFTIEERTEGEIKTISYNNITIEANSRAYLENISQSDYSMQVDLDNDSVIETVKTPDTVVIDYSPLATITSPANNSVWNQGQAITFSGAGIDPEDGALNDLVWISDRDDVVGQGNFTIANLSAGTHRITLRVNDSIGQVNTSSIVLTVIDTMPPNVIIDYPPENKIFKNPNVNFRGIAYDDSGIANVTVNGIQAGQENWNVSIILSEGKNTIRVIAADKKGFNKSTDRIVYYNSSLASDNKPPGNITNLAYTVGYDNISGAWINWTWNNPQDLDFSYSIVYLDGIPMRNTTNSSVNFTGLSSNASYDISIKTADIVDNINYFAVNGTARTLARTTYINGTVIDRVTKTSIAGAKISANNGNSAVSDSLGFYLLAVQEGEYNLTARLDPAYYINSSIQISTIGNLVAEQDIELTKKPTGTISGGVRRK